MTVECTRVRCSRKRKLLREFLRIRSHYSNCLPAYTCRERKVYFHSRLGFCMVSKFQLLRIVARRRNWLSETDYELFVFLLTFLFLFQVLFRAVFLHWFNLLRTKRMELFRSLLDKIFDAHALQLPKYRYYYSKIEKKRDNRFSNDTRRIRIRFCVHRAYK